MLVLFKRDAGRNYRGIAHDIQCSVIMIRAWTGYAPADLFAGVIEGDR